jgi:hypothetical protein
MMTWKEQLNGDCPKRDAPQLHDRCDLMCPDLPKVLQGLFLRTPTMRSCRRYNVSTVSSVRQTIRDGGNCRIITSGARVLSDRARVVRTAAGEIDPCRLPSHAPS